MLGLKPQSLVGVCLGVLALAAIAGCQQPPVVPRVEGAGGGVSTSQPAKLQPLPAKALVGLDQLTPAVTKPVNPDTATRPVSPQASDALAEAERALAAGDLTKAIDRLERASGFEPNNPRVRRSLAMAYASRGDLGKALPNIKVAVKVAPDDVESQTMLGKLLASQHLDDDAFVAYRTALVTSQAQPQNPIAAEALYNLAKLLQEDGYWTASLDAYTRLASWVEKYGKGYAGRREMRELALRPERLQTARGQLLMELRRPAEAVEPLQKSFETNRTDMASARLLLEALISTKQYPRAEKLLVDLTGENTQGAQLTMLAESLCRSAGDPDMPARIWEGFRKKNNINPLLAIALAKISERLGKVQDARTILQSVADSMPGNLPVANALAGVLARQGQRDEALQALAQAVRRNPEDALEIADGVRQVAVAKAGPVVSNGAQDFAAAFIDGMFYLEMRNPDAALKAFAFSASQKKDFLAAYEAQVNIHLESNQFEQAQKVADSLDKGYFADYLKGKILLAQDKPAEAQKVLEPVRKSNAKFAPAMMLLAEAYSRQNRPDNAVDALFAAIEADPEQMDAYRRMFEIYLAARQYSDAQAVIGRFLERQPQNIRGLIMLAELNLAINQRPTAMGILSQLLEQAPDNVDVNLLAARAAIVSSPGLVSKAQFDEAMKYVEQALKADPRNDKVLRVKAELLAQPGRFTQAAATWKLLCEQSRRDELTRNYAAACMLSGDYASAVAALEPLAGKTADLPIRQALVEALPHTSGGLAKASSLLTQWLKEDLAKDDARRGWDIDQMIKLYDSATDKTAPGAAKVDVSPLIKALDDFLANASPQLQSALVREKIRFLVRTGQYDQALKAADAVSDADARRSARLMLTAMLSDVGQFDRGQSLLDGWIASEQDKNHRERYRGDKVLGYCSAGNYDKAQEYVAAWLKESPQAVPPRVYLVDGLASQKQYDKALKVVEAWLAERSKSASTASAPVKKEPPAADELTVPTDPTAFLQHMHVRLLLSLDRYADALKMADQYLKTAGDDGDMLNLKSSALTELGRHDDSLAVLEKVLSIRPDDAGANNNLGYMYAEQGKQLDKAEKMLRKALKERPEEPSFLDSLGWILYRQGRTSEAAALLREVVLDQDNAKAMHPVIFDHAGDAYWKLGWTDEAVAFWNKALELAKAQKDQSTEVKTLVKNTSAKLKAVSAKKQPQIAQVAPPAASQPASKPTTASAPAASASGTSKPAASRPGTRPARGRTTTAPSGL